MRLPRIDGHAKANLCYAWYDKTKGYEGFVTVIGVSPIDSSQKAVQAYIVNMMSKWAKTA